MHFRLSRDTLKKPSSRRRISGKGERNNKDKNVQKMGVDRIYTLKRKSGSHQQSTVDNAIYRYKTIIRRKVIARTE